MIRRNNYYVFQIMADQFGLVQAISTRSLGNMADQNLAEREKNQASFLKALGLKRKNLVMMEQIHGNKVKLVKSFDRGKEISGVDGLVTQEKGVILSIKTADCLPLVVFDPKGKLLGVAHAGWRGILTKIGVNLIEAMKKQGASPRRILVGIGPHIGRCCYLVKKDRTESFKKIFGALPGMISQRKRSLYLNLEIPLKDQLLCAGILPGHLEISTFCTACQKEDFFSARREKQPSKEFLTVAAMKGVNQ